MDGLLSQEEINALFSSGDDDDVVETGASSSSNEALTPEEKDAIGEISNISMGTSATTLSALVNLKVDISTPTVSVLNWDKLVEQYDKPCIFIQILYKEGLDGNNILILKETDVKIIADLMMGGSGVAADGPLSDIHLSAISEAMNQMMGSASTSISSMIETKVDITPPDVSIIDMHTVKDAGSIAPFLANDFVKVSFKMEIGDLVNSELMQLYPVEFAKNLYRKFAGEPDPAPTPAPAPAPAPTPAPAPAPAATVQQPQMQQMPQMQMPQMQMPQMQMQQMPMGMMTMAPQPADVNVSAAQFQPFMQVQSPLLQTENIDLLLDVPLEVSVELGRTNRTIREILDFAPGTVVELNKLAGEPIDVLVNGKYVAKGEVVVIGESFGIKVTEVIK